MINFGKVKYGYKVNEIVIIDYHKRELISFQNFGNSIVISFVSDNKKTTPISLSIKPEDGIAFRSLISKHINLFDNTPIKISEDGDDMVISVPNKEDFYIICQATKEKAFNDFSEFMKKASQSMPEIEEEAITDFCKAIENGVQIQMKPVASAEKK